jgi:hypothetical protein
MMQTSYIPSSVHKHTYSLSRAPWWVLAYVLDQSGTLPKLAQRHAFTLKPQTLSSKLEQRCEYYKVYSILVVVFDYHYSITLPSHKLFNPIENQSRTDHSLLVTSSPP